jgi:putative nucleotidyltransferase with HDIG domain
MMPGENTSDAAPFVLLEGMVRAITSTLELRDGSAVDHQQNVAYLAECIAEEIAMPKFERSGLVIAASLHDIGKIALPPAILGKPGRVSKAERVVVQTHCEIGADLFKHLDLPWPITDMILQHHERLDGSGYPQRLKRDAICEGARIIAIADTYDAMSSDRPYRRAKGTRAAIEALREGRDQLYDSDLVDAFLRLALDDPSFAGRYPDSGG